MENYRNMRIISSSNNTYKMNEITLGQSVSNFFKVAKNILSNKINYELNPLTVNNMGCTFIRSDKIILEIKGKYIPCYLCVEFNGIDENYYYLEPCQGIGTRIKLTELNDTHTNATTTGDESEIFKNILMT
jgi:hypothetical protein